MLPLLITGKALDSSVKNTLLLSVKILESNAMFLDTSAYEKLPLVIMPIKPGTTETFYPDALKNVSSSSIQMIKSDPRGMKFVKGKTEKANVNPTIKDIGSHIIRFFGSSQEGTKYM